MMDYEKIIPEKIRNIKPSGIRKFFDVAQQMEGVISLGVGEPDFVTPWSVRNVAIHTLERGKTAYTANAGLIELRQEISKYINKKWDTEYNPASEIVITVGGSEAIDMSVRALTSPGDEILIPEPSFVCYAPIVTLAGGTPVPISTKIENNFKLMAEELKEKITDKTKALILPFPNNPTGAIMTKEDLEPIAEVLRDTNIMILSDEIYAELTYGRKHYSIIQLEGMRERTVLISGFSKAYAMTGWRLGYVCAPPPVMEQILKLHQYAIMCSPTMSQYAAIEALRNCEEEVKKMTAEYDTRRRMLVENFNRIGLTCFNPEGAFYVFPSIKSTGLTSEEFCEQLLYKHKVAVVPGNAFGESGEGFIRVSYAYSLKYLFEALKRIEEFLNELKKES